MHRGRLLVAASLAVAMAGLGPGGAVANASGKATASKSGQQAMMPASGLPRATPSDGKTTDSLRAAAIVRDIRHPEAGRSLVRQIKPTDRIRIVHLNTSRHGLRQGTLEAAIGDNLPAIKKLRASVEHRRGLTLELQSMHVDPITLVGAGRQQDGTIVFYIY